jgi:hypothetical protein
MASGVGYHSFLEKLAESIIDLDGHTLKVALTNAAPNASTHDELADITEISAGNGYSAGGGTATLVTSAQSAGTYALALADVVFTASGAVGPFRYAVLYDDSVSGDPLIASWDYGSSITLANGDTFTVNFGASVLTMAFA